MEGTLSMGIRQELLSALFDPMLQVKRNSIAGLRQIVEQKARTTTLPTWWQWTLWLAFAITARRIENA